MQLGATRILAKAEELLNVLDKRIGKKVLGFLFQTLKELVQSCHCSTTYNILAPGIIYTVSCSTIPQCLLHTVIIWPFESQK